MNSFDLSSFLRSKILVIGDVMLDEYHWCKVNRISPEAPVPICQVERTTHVPGGASNVANNIHCLGATAYLLGVIGQDSSAAKLISACQEFGLSTEGLIQDASRPTILKSRVVAHHQHVIRLDREHTSDLSEEITAQLKKSFDRLLPICDGVVISDYLKGTLTPDLLAYIIAGARAAKKPIVVDPKGRGYDKYRGATVLTPNFLEFETVISPNPVDTEDHILEGALELIAQLSLSGLVVTRSEKGMSVVTPDGVKVDIPTQARQVFDITGAGDTVISLLVLALSSGFDLEKSARIANAGAGIVVAKVGTSTITLAELQDALLPL
jgi:D-beta-D-heptose 7-phosphate kinase/D-beta-D-heptose 1-phosphate adenosyltransferase